MRSRIGLGVVALVALVAGCTRGATTGGTTLPQPRPLPAVEEGGRAGPVVRVVERVLPSVVNVTTDQSDLQIGGGGGRGVGTGFVVTPDGFIVTNWHVVEGASRIRVTTSGEDPRTFDARVVGGDASADLAVLKVDASGLPALPMGRSTNLRLGQPVVAIGYALALEGGPTVTAGIVSALGRVVTARDPACDPEVCGPDQERTYRDVIQTDAAINPGNSGGPLVDLRGRVVGINTAGVQAGAAENIGFAIAIDAARPTIEEAVANPEAPVPYLGVVTTSVNRVLAIQYGLPVDVGALVLEVAPGGPAERAGLQRGDVIVGFGGQSVADSEALGALIRSRRPGQRVEVGIVSADGSRRTLQVTLGVNPLPNPVP
jgi:S1-C subfamily serine protease